MIDELVLPEARQKFWRKTPDWERERIKAMLEVIKQGDTIIDVGAELGDITALLAKHSGGEMYLIEPVARAWPSIRWIFENNDLNTPNCFVGFAGNKNRRYKGSLFTHAWPSESEGELVDEPGFQHLNERHDLPVIKIDSLKLKKCDVITIDTEGSEFEVIKGAKQTIKRFKPVIFVSIHPGFMDQRYKTQAQVLVDYIKALNYESYLIAIDHEIHVRFRPL